MGDWDTLACNGISLAGSHLTARNNVLKNVNFGISVSGDSSLVENNVIENFSGDGLRGIGNYLTFQYNTVRNCYDVNANHDDGFQSWSVGSDGKVGTGVIKNITLRGNLIINYTDPAQKFRGTLQGIGCFDGFFENWIIENNIILTDHWHGITLLGARNCRIVNNTVYDLNSERPGPPWIQIGNHKNGQLSQNCIIRNNLSSSINTQDGPAVQVDHNIIINDPNEFFVDYSIFDMRLKDGCTAIDSGSSDSAPSIDFAQNSRPQGSGFDVGAFEFGPANSVVPNGHSFKHTIQVWPNPFRNKIFISFTENSKKVNGKGRTVLEIFNLQGKLIYLSLSYLPSVVSSNAKGVVWQGQDIHGIPVPNGIYLIQWATQKKTFSHKVVLAR